MRYPENKSCPVFHSASEDIKNAKLDPMQSPQAESPAYRLAYDDLDFILRDEMRPVRLLLELSKPEITLQDHGIEQTVVIYGSARTLEPDVAKAKFKDIQERLDNDPENTALQDALIKTRAQLAQAKHYEDARELARLITLESNAAEYQNTYVVTGGGPGIMEAANRGASEAGGETIGLNIVLPHEQHPNRYITPDLCFRFHYFAMRKMHFLLRARALVVFPGGFGTLDELFETLTLVQTGKIKRFPILLFNSRYWNKLINFDFLIEEGMISAKDIDLFKLVDTPQQAWDFIHQTLSEIKE